MGALSPTHWLIIVGVLVLLFGAKRLPDAARSIGRSARILKAEVKEINPGAFADTATDAATVAALPRAHVTTQNPTSTISPDMVTQTSAAATSTDGGNLAAVVGDHPGR